MRIRIIPIFVLALMMAGTAIADAGDRFGFAASVGASLTSAEQAWWPDEDFSGTHLRLVVHGTITQRIGLEAGWSGLGAETLREEIMVACPGSCPSPRPRMFEDVRHSGSVAWFGITPGFRDARQELVAKLGYSRVERKYRGFTYTDSGLMVGVGFARFGEAPWGFRLDLENHHGLARVFGASVTYRL